MVSSHNCLAWRSVNRSLPRRRRRLAYVAKWIENQYMFSRIPSEGGLQTFICPVSQSSWMDKGSRLRPPDLKRSSRSLTESPYQIRLSLTAVEDPPTQRLVHRSTRICSRGGQKIKPQLQLQLHAMQMRCQCVTRTRLQASNRPND